MKIDTFATIIITWNQTALTLECLEALVAAGIPSSQIWVIDNGSQPSALPQINACFPEVHVLRLEENQGFAAGCNSGARAALAAGADIFFFLNNDALVEPETVPALTTALIQHECIAAVSPKVYYHNTPRIIQSVGLRIDPHSGRARMIGHNEPDRGQYNQPTDREALFGCALLIRRTAWEQVGQFWEPFFNYAEESDWCLRARRQGWRLLYVPQAVVWHHASRSLGSESPFKTYLITRNQFYLRQRHHSSGWRGWWGLITALYWYARTWLRFMRLGQPAHAHAVVLALWDFWRGRSGNCRTVNLKLRDNYVQPRSSDKMRLG